MFSLVDFLTYALITAITPGPNNIMSMSNASRAGFVRTLPFNVGIFAGFCIVVAMCTFFTALLENLIPVIEKPMLIGGALYILYLAWKTWKSSTTIEEKHVTSSFFTGFSLQFINPKIYVYSIVSMDAYILPYYAENLPVLAFFVFLLAFIGFVCTLLWSAFGSLFVVFFSRYAKITNAVMALLLVYCAINLFL